MKTFLPEYIDMYNKGMTSISEEHLQLAILTIQLASENNKNIFVGGNGGSAAISNHLCCDFMKGTEHIKHKSIKSISLSCNIPLITAIANDLGYQETLSYQLKHLMNDGDVVILISSSGNSQNIIEALELAKAKGNIVIGFSGFSGGKLNELADVKLHIPINNYGVVEDCHQSLMHIIAQYISQERINHVHI